MEGLDNGIVATFRAHIANGLETDTKLAELEEALGDHTGDPRFARLSDEEAALLAEAVEMARREIFATITKMQSHLEEDTETLLSLDELMRRAG